jgi:hypothetical protein
MPNDRVLFEGKNIDDKKSGTNVGLQFCLAYTVRE